MLDWKGSETQHVQQRSCEEIAQTHAATIISSQRATATTAAGLQPRGGVEEAPRNQTQQERLAHEAAAGSISVMLGSDGFRNAVTTATIVGQWDGCKEKHHCQTQWRHTEQWYEAACRKKNPRKPHAVPTLGPTYFTTKSNTPSMLITVWAAVMNGNRNSRVDVWKMKNDTWTVIKTLAWFVPLEEF